MWNRSQSSGRKAPLPWALAVVCLSTCACAMTLLAAEPKAPQGRAEVPNGHVVKVTPQMIGAGIVSSGVALPPIPPATGSREKPVASWGRSLPYPIVIAGRRNNRLIEIAPAATS